MPGNNVFSGWLRNGLWSSNSCKESEWSLESKASSHLVMGMKKTVLGIAGYKHASCSKYLFSSLFLKLTN